MYMYILIFISNEIAILIANIIKCTINSFIFPYLNLYIFVFYSLFYVSFSAFTTFPRRLPTLMIYFWFKWSSSSSWFQIYRQHPTHPLPKHILSQFQLCVCWILIKFLYLYFDSLRGQNLSKHCLHIHILIVCL